MVWICGLKISIFVALIFCTDFASMSLDECSITEREGVYYSTRASNSSGKLLKTFEDKSKEECRNSCCELEQCNFMMYTTVLRDHEKSTNITCFLFNCTEILKCKTQKLPANITGVSFIGIKQENLTEASSYTNSTIEQHKTYKPPLSSTVRTLEMHSPTNTTMQNMENILNFNKINNSDVSGLHNTTNVPPKTMHSPINPSYVPSNLASISNTSYPTISMSNPGMSISNSIPSTLSMIIPSPSTEIQMNSNHSLSTLSHPSTSMHNTNRSTLSTFIHSTPIHMHTLGNSQRSNNSLSHVGQLSGSHSDANDGSKSSRYQNHTLDKISSYTLSSMSVSADSLVSSLKSYSDSEIATSSPSIPSTFVYSSTQACSSASTSGHASGVQNSPHFKTEALAVSTMSSLEAMSRNVSHLHPSSSLQNSFQVPTSHTSKGNRKKFSEQQSHTTTVSLVISLIFGILFFGTVVFLIGRRWSEQCFRRGYSRVDYLLNDYD